MKVVETKQTLLRLLSKLTARELSGGNFVPNVHECRLLQVNEELVLLVLCDREMPKNPCFYDKSYLGTKIWIVHNLNSGKTRVVENYPQHFDRDLYGNPKQNPQQPIELWQGTQPELDKVYSGFYKCRITALNSETFRVERWIS